ncbi:MAG: PQQ-binding-like beta-propeller repeat protein, partial [bacterium]|nr:PQQ-binding-like beta-propeller repeat protein [bacterium]
YDMLATMWGGPLLADGKVYIGDEDGDIAVLGLAKELEEIAEVNVGNSVYSSPVAVGETLYISTRSHLFAIGEE